MIGRLLEDAFFAGRFLYFYWKAPKHIVKLGFAAADDKLTIRNRGLYAWNKMNYKV